MPTIYYGLRRSPRLASLFIYVPIALLSREISVYSPISCTHKVVSHWLHESCQSSSRAFETWGILRLKQAFQRFLMLSNEVLTISFLLLIISIRRIVFYFRMLLAESTSSATEEASGASDFAVQQPENGEDPFPRWKGKGKAVMASNGTRSVSAGTSSSEVTVDWTQYDPPEGLKELAGSKSDIVVQIIQESIDRIKVRNIEDTLGKVKARIIEEEERRRVEREAIRLRERESENPRDTDTQHTSLDERPRDARVSTDGNDSHPPEVPAKSKKRSLFNILRRLNKASEGGESSATGAVLHKRDVSWSSLEMSAQAAKRRFVPDVLRKTPTNSNSSPTSSARPSIYNAEVECVSCLDDFNPKEMVKAPCHSYCKPCFRRLIHTTCENEQQWPPKCCLNPIPTNTIILNIDEELKRTYRGRAAEWDLPISDRIYCSQSSCSIWIRPDQINHARNIARCSGGHWTCTICRGRQHEGDDCPQDRDMLRTDELAEEEGWKRCYGCHAYVEHREACQHMTCRCGAEFCYVCGARWRTCACNMDQLAAVKRGAEQRRQARRREAQEDAEIQEALRLVEEFEREEALKAELLRQEQIRLAEERRARLLEERIRREGERRRAVEVKFLELREVFSNIHELQRIIVQSSHSEEESSIKRQGAAELMEFKEKRKAEWEKLNAASKAKLDKRENVLQREYVARVAEERRVENQYQFELEAYWSRKKDGEAKVEDAMKELKRKMDDGFRQWEKWRDTELDNYRFLVKEELVIQEELMEEAERRLVEGTREKQNAFSLRKAAELRWVDVVMEERDRMLTNMEVNEIDNGENVDAWFEDDGLDDISMEDMDILREFHVPGAFL
ncbi:hypothetical protein F5Y13DRAFT_105322 [Hypoxylon sp. FL1857]|nr:hypothetical protein F5Y13DRAFT_105322 [Hypoxylon sp. FL1857]